MAADQITMPALGRPFSLGMLYDARKDELHTGFTLWDKNTIDKIRIKQTQNFSEHKITTSDSIEEKSSLMEIESSLKVSVLCGLIKVGRSAKYLNDNKEFKNQSRVTLLYKATTHFESISNEFLKNMQMEALPDKFAATHLVTGLLYGADAFFVFDSDRVDATHVEHLQRDMQCAVNLIPLFNVKEENPGGINPKIPNHCSDEKKAVTKKFSCKFYGDFILPSNPATFEDAVKTYRELPNLLGKEGENAVPVKVWLTPLSYYTPTAETVKGEVSIGLLRKAAEALEDMKEIDMRCNDALEESVVKNFPEVQKTVKDFQELCSDYTTKLQQIMREKFPAIRAGEEDNSSVEKLLEEKQKSPFSHKNLDKWLDNTEREIHVMQSCVGMMKGTVVKIVPNQSELEREVLTPGVEHSLCFTFTYETDDPYLKVMTDYLSSNESHCFISPAENLWHSSGALLAEIRHNAGEFYNLAKALKKSSRFRFLVALRPDKDQKGAAIYHYKGGSLQPGKFSKPEIRDVTTVTDRTDLLWYATDLTLDPDTANGYLGLTEDNKKATCQSWQTYPDHHKRFDKQIQVLCKEGLKEKHYWEVEWSISSKNEVGVAVAFAGIARKGNGYDTWFGYNSQSWYFHEYGGLSARHDEKEVWTAPIPPTGCDKVGVYLDWPAGTLSFYSVSSDTLRHLYTFQAKFTEPLYPGFRLYDYDSYATLSPIV